MPTGHLALRSTQLMVSADAHADGSYRGILGDHEAIVLHHTQGLLVIKALRLFEWDAGAAGGRAGTAVTCRCCGRAALGANYRR